jgi:hypothetical protein
MHAIDDLIELFASGGLTVITPEIEEEDRGRSIVPERTLIRSVIQPDGDFITRITQEACKQPRLWRNHLAEVESRIEAIWGLRILLNFGLLFPAGLLLWYIWGDIIGRWEEILMKALTTLAVGLLIWLGRYLVSFIFRLYIRRVIKKRVVA